MNIEQCENFSKTNSLIGRTLDLDLGSLLPINVTIKEITNIKVLVVYNNSTEGRIEEFSIEDFEYLSGLKLDTSS
jgi:transcriptional regulatory protein LevR